MPYNWLRLALQPSKHKLVIKRLDKCFHELTNFLQSIRIKLSDLMAKLKQSKKYLIQQDPLMQPNDAVARADGIAQANDGSLYISDSEKGRLWRVMYTGKK